MKDLKNKLDDILIGNLYLSNGECLIDRNIAIEEIKDLFIDTLLGFGHYYNKEVKQLPGESKLMIDKVHILEYLKLIA